LSTGRVKQATTMAARRSSRREMLRAEVHVKDMVLGSFTPKGERVESSFKVVTFDLISSFSLTLCLQKLILEQHRI